MKERRQGVEETDGSGALEGGGLIYMLCQFPVAGRHALFIHFIDCWGILLADRVILARTKDDCPFHECHQGQCV